MAEYLRQQNRIQLESKDLPVLCSECLGPKKYMKMYRSILGAECKMCHKTFTTYRWRKGGSTMINTSICTTCSKLKNVCQCCLLDFDLKIPIYIRDSFKQNEQNLDLQEKSEQMALYYSEQAERMLESGENKHLVEHQLAPSTEKLMKIVEKNPFDLRNNTELPGEIVPPVDKSVTTLYAGGLVFSGYNKILEKDLRDNFAPYGKIKKIKLIKNQKCALITFKDRISAEVCAKALYNRLEIKENKIRILWAKPKKKRKLKKKGSGKLKKEDIDNENY